MIRSFSIITRKIFHAQVQGAGPVFCSCRGKRMTKRPPDPWVPKFPEESKYISQFDDLDLNGLKPQYQHVKALENAPTDIRKVFSLGFGNNNELLEAKLQQYAKQLQRHEFDYDSLEMKITQLTVRIRYLQECFVKAEVQRKKKLLEIKDLVQQRTQLLLKLRASRYEKYALVMQVLNLNLTFEPVYDWKLTRRAARIDDMRTRTFAEIKRRKDDRQQRIEELAKVQAEIEKKIKSGEIALPE